MQIAVGQDDKPDILRMGVFPGLVLADKRIKLFGFRFEDGYREAAFLQQEVINIAARGFSKSSPKASRVFFFSLMWVSRVMLAGPLSSSKKRQPEH